MNKLLLFWVGLISLTCGSIDRTAIKERPVPGPAGIPGEPGEKGEPGEQGERGERGEPGKSCSVQQQLEQIIINCPDGTSAMFAPGHTETKLIYIGQYCSRPVMKVGTEFYIAVPEGLRSLTKAWLQITKKCKIRLNKNSVQEQVSS